MLCKAYWRLFMPSANCSAFITVWLEIMKLPAPPTATPTIFMSFISRLTWW